MKKGFLIMCLSGVLLVGCGEKLKSGEIYDKHFSPAHTVTVLVPNTYTDGKNSYTTYLPVTHRYPDRWSVDIRSMNPDKEGKYQTATYWVEEAVYDECEIGGLFEYDPERDFTTEPLEKARESGN